MRKFPSLLILAIAVAALVFCFFKPDRAVSQEWHPVRSGILFGISGMATIDRQSDSNSFLIVHDNKKQGQGRLATLTINGKQPPQYLPVNWPNDTELPADLESITTVPGVSKPTFMAASSTGKVYHFTFDASKKQISILKVFDLPNITNKSNIEAFALQKINGLLFAVWAHRGQDQDPGVIYWGLLDEKKYQFSQTGSRNLQVPLPVSAVRHVSDLKVDPAGIVFISSASDPGDNGPFASAVYVEGAIAINSDRISFNQNSQLVPLYRFDAHKIEAIELLPGRDGGVIFGTDDENMGGSVYLNW